MPEALKERRRFFEEAKPIKKAGRGVLFKEFERKLKLNLLNLFKALASKLHARSVAKTLRDALKKLI